ncbi:MAG: type II toxin-antitoxin system antitoxin DNA ADP-ribosyl glycohydrolase DarG [Chloroflexota bacterium]
MIEHGHGNLLKTDAEALVNTVNCVGVMGKGVALQFKQAFPESYRRYVQACAAGEVQPGRMFVVPTDGLVNPKFIINFPTKRHWKAKSRLEDIDAGLQALVEEVQQRGIRSIALPALGCGNGGLQWSEVRPRIEAAFAALAEVRVVMFAPEGAPEAIAMPVATSKPRMTLARSALVLVLAQYGLPGYRLSLLEVQKLAYFLQVAGVPLKLEWAKRQYGPYAGNLNHVLQRMEGHYIRGYGDRSRQAMICPLPDATEGAREFLGSAPEAAQPLKKVSQLIEGFETPYGMELLATVHWVAQEDSLAASDASVAIAKVHAWSERKRKLLKPEHIRKAWQRLHDELWLPVITASDVVLARQ